MRAPHLLLYGDVNLNILDGSAIWLASLTEALSRISAHATVLLKAPIDRELVTGPLAALPGVSLLPPAGDRPMRPIEAVDAMLGHDAATPFDAIVLRGFHVASEAARRAPLQGRLWPYLTDVPQRTVDVTPEFRTALADIAAASDLLLCQTEELRAFLEAQLPGELRRTALLPPMVPDVFHPPPTTPPPRAATKLLYAGKFAPLWGIVELADAVAALRAQHPDLELHLAGDKIHAPPDQPAFAPGIRRILESGDGVVWHGALAREEVAALAREADLAISARDRRMSDSLELSTKVLEYGASGLPVVLNRTAMHARILGDDYPLFVDDLDDLPALLAMATTDGDLLADARQRVMTAAEPFRLDAVAASLRPYVARLAPLVRVDETSARRLVVAGHDMKFLRPYLPWLERTGFEVRIDRWLGHERHDEEASRDLLAWADTILAEWCLGNASWYARHKRPEQRLVIRFHRQELETPYPRSIDATNTSAVIVVSDRLRATARGRFGWPEELMRTIPNAADTFALDRPKLDHADRTLGLLGALPSLKRLDRAVDLLESLLSHDPTWRLRIAGPLPFESDWVWSRLNERTWFARQMERIRSSPRLRWAVSFDGHVDPPTWFQQIGFVLSPSDQESFHLAVVEGMASGARPVIWDREGASELFAARWIVEDTPGAVRLVQVVVEDPGSSDAAQKEARSRYALDNVALDLVRVVADQPV